jgi:aspartate aminotransferase-like enzyme
MENNSFLRFKVASEDWEFEQIHRLNYRTFVEEIPQHETNPDGRLVDKFHEENTYAICLDSGQLLGMAAIRGKRPFSLDDKLGNVNVYFPEAHSMCEIRLLAIENNHRGGRILQGLLELLIDYYDTHGHDLVIISAVVGQIKLYRHIGFVPFGPLVGTTEARFQPMYLNHQKVLRLKERLRRLARTQPSSSGPEIINNFLPGPVNISRDVRQIFSGTPISHRSEKFVNDFQQTKQLLCQLVNSQHVEILPGSGTLANDAIGAQISLIPGQGLILSNGEFGNRLVDHATRLRLSFKTLAVEWGDTFDPAAIIEAINANAGIVWLWAVHCETSTGILNDIEKFKNICAERKILLCLDCISSIGTIPLDLGTVYLASGVSGKGLKAFPGLSMVFYNHDILPSPTLLPRYLDLGLYATNKGVPFTISSNLVYALRTALEHYHQEKVFCEINELSSWIKANLHKMGFRIVGSENHLSPAVITIELPSKMDSKLIGHELEEAGYVLSYRSQYLLQRNWMQICLMGECSRESIASLLEALERFVPTESRLW